MGNLKSNPAVLQRRASVNLKIHWSGISRLVLLLLLLSGAAYSQLPAPKGNAKLMVTDLKTEHQKNPVGVDQPAPRLSWKINSGLRNIMQTNYQIRVAKDEASLLSARDLTWDSGDQKSDASVLIPYGGPALEPSTRYYWQVKVKDNKGRQSAWSAVHFWQTGLMDTENWTAKWITSAVTDTVQAPSPMFRKEFAIEKVIKSAVLYITAHGLYEAQLNGKRVGDDYMAPGWTSYHKRLLYQSYDVTRMLKNGANVIGFTLGDGWYRGYLAFDRRRNFYGNKVSGRAQLQVTYTDGSRKIIETDESWKYNVGPIRLSDLYNGEVYDARQEKEGWSAPGYENDTWKAVQVIPAGKEAIVSSISPLAKKHEQFKVIKVIKTPKGETVLDFGQNLVGWVQFKLSATAGTSIQLEHGEVLDKEGDFYNANLRHARQSVSYIFKGKGIESYEPHFTYQGFRYVKVSGLSAQINPADFMAVAVYANMDTTGSLQTSNALLNQLQHNIQWGQKGNFMDVPTDCPQRDERLGWTGDAQVFFRTAAFNMDVSGFFTKWMKDVAADQFSDGNIPFVVPNVLDNGSAGSAGWSDVATIIPWNMYLAYGDKDILVNQYPSMKGWVDYMVGKSRNDLWNTGFHFGDWLFYRPADDNDGRSAITDKYLIAQCFYAHSTQLLINAAHVLGNKDDETKYTDILDKIKKAFVKEYMTPSGRLVSGSQTAYVLALNFDMLPENLRQQAVDFLVNNINSYGDHLTTGFLGTPYLCQVLTRFGRTDVAYKLLLQESYPSWLYPVKMGATTIWERWDGIKPDGSFQTTDMNSFNHYAYGAIGDWMYRVMAGLDSDDSGPGYKKVIIAPHPGGQLSHASAKLETVYGLTASEWQIENGKFKLKVTIPPNATALIKLPGAAKANITESGKAIKGQKSYSGLTYKGSDAEITVGSGVYLFEYVL